MAADEDVGDVIAARTFSPEIKKRDFKPKTLSRCFIVLNPLFSMRFSLLGFRMENFEDRGGENDSVSGASVVVGGNVL